MLEKLCAQENFVNTNEDEMTTIDKVREIAQNIKNIAQHQPQDKAILEQVNVLIEALAIQKIKEM